MKYLRHFTTYGVVSFSAKKNIKYVTNVLFKDISSIVFLLYFFSSLWEEYYSQRKKNFSILHQRGKTLKIWKFKRKSLSE